MAQLDGDAGIAPFGDADRAARYHLLARLDAERPKPRHQARPAIVMIDDRTNDPYIVHLSDEQASDLYYQLQRIRNLAVQAALMDVTAEAVRTIQANVFGDYS